MLFQRRVIEGPYCDNSVDDGGGDDDDDVGGDDVDVMLQNKTKLG